MTKYEHISHLADDSMKRLAEGPEEWTSFLKTAARIYRYPFKEQLLIHAQRPDATACASIEIWNERMHCWVNRGAKGIALIDESFPDRHKLKYVFDVSDVHRDRNGGILPAVWEMKPEYEQTVIGALERIYGGTDPDLSFAGRLMELSENIAADYVPDILPDLMEVKEGSFLSGLDDLNVEKELRETLAGGIAYTLLTRCGLDADAYTESLSLEHIRDFNSTETMGILGNAVSEMAEPVLREICRTVMQMDRRAEIEAAKAAEKRENIENTEKGVANTTRRDYNALKRKSDRKEKGGDEHGDNLQERGRLSDSGSGLRGGAGGGADKIRAASSEVLKGAPSRDLHREAAFRDAQGTLPDDSETGRGEGRSDHTPDDAVRGSERGAEGQGSDGVGSQDEPDPQHSGRDSAWGDRLQPVIKFEQMSLFPSMAEQIGIIEAAAAGRKIPAPAAFSLSEEQIGEILRMGSGRENSRMRIYEKYREGYDPAYMADFLKNEYRSCGKGLIFDGHEISVWFHEDGMKIGYGRQAQDSHFMEMTWEEIEAHISGLVGAGEYLNSNEAFLSDAVIRDEIADNVYFFFRDTMDEMPESIGLSRRKDEKGNTYSTLYADGKENLKELLATPDGVARVRTEVDAAVEALRTGEKTMRFRPRQTPEQLQEKLAGYGGFGGVFCPYKRRRGCGE